MTKITLEKITDIPETMLIPLYCKAAETKREDMIINDVKAVEIIDRIDYDFSKFDKIWMSQLGVAVRTMIFDREVGRFIEQNKNAIVVNLGCGLDTRPERLKDIEVAVWYDLDVPEAIELRKNFFNETEHNCFISKSVFDFTWIDDIRTEGKPILFVAEGLFMYFEESELRVLFNKLAEHFPDSEILFECIAPMIVGKSKQHDAVKHTNGKAEFKWGINNGKLMESWNPKIKFLDQWEFFDYHRRRIKRGFRMMLGFPGVKKNFDSRIIHLKFNS